MGSSYLLTVFFQLYELNHQVGGHDGQRQVDLHLCLPRRQLSLLGFVPARRPRRDGVRQTGRGPERLFTPQYFRLIESPLFPQSLFSRSNSFGYCIASQPVSLGLVKSFTLSPYFNQSDL